MPPSLVPRLASLATAHLLPAPPSPSAGRKERRSPRRRPRAPTALSLSRSAGLGKIPTTPAAFLRAAPSRILYSSFERAKRLTGHHLPVYCVLVSAASDQYVTGGDDGLIKIWSARTGYLERTFRGHDGDIIELALLPGTDMMVSAANDSTVRLWCLRTGAALGAFPSRHTRGVNTIAVSPAPDRPWLVSGGTNSELRLWCATDPTCPAVVVPIPAPAHPAPPAASAALARTRATAAMIPQDADLALGEGRNFPSRSNASRARAAATPGAQPPLPPPRSPRATTSAAASVAAGSHAQAAGGGLPPVLSGVLPLQGGAAANSIASGSVSVEVLSVTFNAGGTRFAVSGTDCAAHVYAVDVPATPAAGGPARESTSDIVKPVIPSVRYLTTLRGHVDCVYLVAFARHCESVATGCRDGTARIWRRTRGRVPVKRRGQMDGMGTWSSVVLDTRRTAKSEAEPRGRAFGGGDASTTNAARARRPPWPGTVDALVWSLDDHRIVTSSSDAQLRVWDAESGMLLHNMVGHTREVYVLVIHPFDRRIVLSAGYDGACMLWDIESGACVKTFAANIGVGTGVRPAGEVTAPVDQAGAVAPVISPRVRDTPNILDGCFSPDGSSFVLSDTSGSFCIFSTDNSEVLALAPEQQFFSNDYVPVVRDVDQNAVDEGTRVPLHMLPRARLCNAEMMPHPSDLQVFSAQQLRSVLEPAAPASLKVSSTRIFRRRGSRLSSKSGEVPDTLMSSLDDQMESEVRGRGDVLAGPIAVIPRAELISRATAFRLREQNREKHLVRQARAHTRRLAKNRLQAQLDSDLVVGNDVNDFLVPDSDKSDSDVEFHVGRRDLSADRSGEPNVDVDVGSLWREKPSKQNGIQPQGRRRASMEDNSSSSESSFSEDSGSSRPLSYCYDSYSESDGEFSSGWSSDSLSSRGVIGRQARTGFEEEMADPSDFGGYGGRRSTKRRKVCVTSDDDDDNVDDDDVAAKGNGAPNNVVDSMGVVNEADVIEGERRDYTQPITAARSLGVALKSGSVGARQTISRTGSVETGAARFPDSAQLVASSKAPSSLRGLRIHLPSAVAARNPSFTSEQPNAQPSRSERGARNDPADTAGDTASFVCSAFASNAVMADGHPTVDDVETRSNTGRDTSAVIVNPRNLNGASTVGSKLGAGNSILSGSPVRQDSRQVDRSRSRPGSQLRQIDGDADVANTRGEEDLVKLDNVSRREVDELDAQRKLRRRKRRRARRYRAEFDEIDPLGKTDSTPRRNLRQSGREDEENETGANPRRRRQHGRLRMRRRRRHSDVDADFSLRPGSKRGSEDHKKRRKRVRALYEDGTGDADDCVSRKRRRRTRSVREENEDTGVAVANGGDELCGDKSSFAVPEGVPARGVANVGAANLKLKVSFPLDASKWLRATSSRYTYVPQINDCVTYFPQGHRKAMQFSRRAGVEALLSGPSHHELPILNGSSTGGNQDMSLTFRIVGIEYRFPVRSKRSGNKARSARAKRKSDKEASLLEYLRVAAVLQLRPEGDTRAPNPSIETADTNDVSLTYFPVDDLPEYLVLTSRVRAAATESWKSGDRFRILFLSEHREWQYYNGLVRRVKPKLQYSPWNAIEVEYDNEGDADKGNKDFVSPWELERALGQSKGKVPTLTPSTSKSLLTTPDAELWHAVSANLEALRGRDEKFRRDVSWFFVSVESLAKIARYCDMVSCPLDLGIVISRMSEGYYRCFDAFVQDMALIRSNAILFNSPGSDIAEAASVVYAKVIDIAERTRVALSGPQNSVSGTASAHGFGGNGVAVAPPGSAVASTRGAFATPSTRYARPKLSPPAVFAVPAGIRDGMSAPSNRHAFHRAPSSAANIVGGYMTGPSASLQPLTAASLGAAHSMAGNLLPPQGYGGVQGRTSQDYGMANMRFLQQQRAMQQQQALQQEQLYSQTQRHARHAPCQSLPQNRISYAGPAYPVGAGVQNSMYLAPIIGGQHQQSSAFAGYGTAPASAPHQAASRGSAYGKKLTAAALPISQAATLPSRVVPSAEVADPYMLRRRAVPPAGVAGVPTGMAVDQARPVTRNSTLRSRGTAARGNSGTINGDPRTGGSRHAPRPNMSLPLPSLAAQNLTRPAPDAKAGRQAGVERRPLMTRGSIGKMMAAGAGGALSVGIVSTEARCDASTGDQRASAANGSVLGGLNSGYGANTAAAGVRFGVESATQSCAGSTEAAGGLPLHATTSESRFMTLGPRDTSLRSPSPQSRTANLTSTQPEPELAGAAGTRGNAGLGASTFANVATTSPGSATPVSATLGAPVLGLPPREHSSISIVAAESTTFEAPGGGKSKARANAPDSDTNGAS